MVKKRNEPLNLTLHFNKQKLREGTLTDIDIIPIWSSELTPHESKERFLIFENWTRDFNRIRLIRSLRIFFGFFFSPFSSIQYP